jgi:hypothetical protein
MRSQDRLILAKVKVERAKENLKEFDRIAETFRDKNHTIVVAHGHGKFSYSAGPPDTRTYPVRSFELFAVAGDIVNNLRSALDHLAWQLVEANGSIPSKHTAFPITTDAKTYEEAKARKVQGMSTDAVRLIDSLKPYQGGNDALWRLHEICNIDKHQTIVAVGQNILLEGVGFEGYFWRQATNPHFHRLFGPTADDKVDVPAKESARQPQVLESETLVPFLHQIVDIVDSVIDQFLPVLE